MKSLTLFIILITYSITGFAQKVSLSDTVTINIPQNAENLTKDEFSHYINEKFGYSKIALNNVQNPAQRSDDKHFYKIDDILIELIHGKRRLTKKDTYLVDSKKQLDALYNLNGNQTNYSSLIKKVNDNTILITYYEMENIGYYDFYCNNVTNTVGLRTCLNIC
jgi:hypothetical protein